MKVKMGKSKETPQFDQAISEKTKETLIDSIVRPRFKGFVTVVITRIDEHKFKLKITKPNTLAWATVLDIGRIDTILLMSDYTNNEIVLETKLGVINGKYFFTKA